MSGEGKADACDAGRKRRPQDISTFERRCHAATAEQIGAAQSILRRVAADATRQVPGGAPAGFIEAIDALKSRPELMLDVAPEFRGVIELVLSRVGA